MDHGRLGAGVAVIAILAALFVYSVSAAAVATAIVIGGAILRLLRII